MVTNMVTNSTFQKFVKYHFMHVLMSSLQKTTSITALSDISPKYTYF